VADLLEFDVAQARAQGRAWAEAAFKIKVRPFGATVEFARARLVMSPMRTMTPNDPQVREALARELLLAAEAHWAVLEAAPAES
jgi:hypothetical protein